jgi:hypothetical protein
MLSRIFPTILTQAPDEELPFEKSIVQRKDESLESLNNEAKLGQRIQEVADRHGLTIFKLPSDLSPRLADFERDSGIKVVFYKWQGKQSSRIERR